MDFLPSQCMRISYMNPMDCSSAQLLMLFGILLLDMDFIEKLYGRVKTIDGWAPHVMIFLEQWSF
jgi:hypothetical protein